MRKTSKVTPSVIARYRAHRATGSSPRTFKVRPGKPPQAVDWTLGPDHLPQAEWKVGGFVVRAAVLYDDIGARVPDYLGKFTDNYKPGAIVRRYRHDEYRYFVPGVSYAEHRRGLQAMGYSKGNADFLARQYNRADYERACRYADGRLCLYGVRVRVYKSGVELGEDSLWGIDADSCTDPYLGEVARQCAAVALSEARRILAKLRRTPRLRRDGRA